FEFSMDGPDPFHAHPHEQITYVADGETWFFLEDEKFLLAKGDMIKIPADARHTIQTTAPHTRLIDCFSPVREDFIKN
ncbi:MAG: cupin domain-containing protein, partial [Prolixibacteraceae bacterium]|nr:cupin domain-containing protein [Prolixibacteraceae bacterium]